MAVLRIVSRGMDRKTYSAARAMLDIDRRHPLGLIMHGAIEEDGVMRVAQIWDSIEYAERFDESILKPVIQAVGAAPTAEILTFELEDLVTP